MTSTPEVRPVVDHARADAGLGGRPGVVVLGVAVDAEQLGVALEHPDDVVVLGRGDPEVPVGEAAVQLHDGAREALQDRDPVQQGLQLFVLAGHLLVGCC